MKKESYVIELTNDQKARLFDELVSTVVSDGDDVTITLKDIDTLPHLNYTEKSIIWKKEVK